ncbi:MAG: trypsin-like peptidase domain-containing protein [Planctomycetaceae bacterium]|jgi:S1-C subfamily serine protease|nr:trypsin-like peptidase domain-containing protein [Planctomycetaceae bacterium]
MNDGKYFYINAVGEKVGPVSFIALKSLAKANVLAPSATIITEDGQRDEARTIQGLFDDVTTAHSLTPLPNSPTRPLASPKPTRHYHAPPAPAMPLAPPTPFESAVPLPITLKSVGETIVEPTNYSWKDNLVVWIIIGCCFLFLFSSVLVGITWHIASQQLIRQYKTQMPDETNKETTTSASNESETSPIKKSSTKKSFTEEVVAKTEKSIALINSPGCCGTGFVIAPGIIATNSHIIASERIDSLEIVFPSAEASLRGTFQPRLLYEDTIRDIALLQIDSETVQALPVAEDYQFRRAQKVITIGNPGRGDGVILENAVSVGVLSTQTEVEGLLFYQLNITINSGNSGSPVLDEEGKVIGMITLKAVNTPSIAYCIPVDAVAHAFRLAQNLTEKEKEEINTKHLAVVGFRQGLEKVANESMFDDSVLSQNSNSAENKIPHQPNKDTVFSESGQAWNYDGTWWSQPPSQQPNSENSWQPYPVEDQGNIIKYNREQRYKTILAKEVWTFHGVPIRGRIVGFREGFVRIRPEGSSGTPIERHAHLFSPDDIDDILFYARYNGIPTGNLGKQ